MSRCFPFPPPGYDNEKKSSNGEIGHVHKIKHKHRKEKKERKRKREDEVQANDLIEKEDKKHKHHKRHKHKKDKRKGRHAEHDEDIKRTGVAHDRSTMEETVFFNFLHKERPGTGSCNNVNVSESERSRQIKDELRDNGMGGNPKMDKVGDNSDCNMRKRKEMDTNVFVGPGDAEESFNKSETIGIKFVGRERLENGKCVKIDLSEREEPRQNNCQTSDNGMEKDQKIGKDGAKSNRKVRMCKKIDTVSSSYGGNAQEIPKKREALSIKFVDKERPCNGKCDKINLLNDQKSLTDRDDNQGIVRKGNEINTNSSLHGDRPWEHLPVLMDKDKQSATHIQTTFAKEVYPDIGKTAQEATNLLVECISVSHVQNAGNHALGKSVDDTSFHPSLSGRDKCSLRNFQSTFTKEAYFSSGRVAQEVKNGLVECIRKTRLEEASNASFDHCIANIRCHPLVSDKEKQFKKCHQAGSAEVHPDSQNKAQDAQGCAVGCIPRSKVQEISSAHLEKCVASVSQHPSTTVKQKGFNNRSQRAPIEDFHSDSLRKVQESKECAVECLPESRIQLVSNAGLEKRVASKNCHPSFSIKEKRSIKHPQTALSEKALFDGKRIGEEANEVAVDCKPGSRSQEASTATSQNGVTEISCSSSFSRNVNGVTSTSCSPSFSGNVKGITRTSCSPFSGEDCERNGVADRKTASHFIGHLHGTTEAVDVSSRSRADCKTTSHFIGHSHGTTEAVDAAPSGITANCKTPSHLIGPSYDAMEAVDVAPGSRADCKTSPFVGPLHGTTKVVPSGSWADENILDLKYFPCLPPKQVFSDFDDQAWLFPSNRRKPNASEKVDHALNVWDRLLVLQHNNTYALPYVTPF